MRVALLFVVITSAACEKERSRAPAPSPRPPASDASVPVDAGPVVPKLTRCGELAAAMCDAYERCKPNEWFLEFNEAANCRREAERECKSWQLAGSSVSDTSIGGCITGLHDVACASFRRWDTPGCQAPKGTLRKGETCALNVQCAEGACFPDDDGCKRCVEVGQLGFGRGGPGKDAGAACKDDSECGETLVCTKKRCARPMLGDVGATCSYPFMGQGELAPCRYGLTCASEGKHDVCKPQPHEGDACTLDGPSCLSPAYCVEGRCQVGVAARCKK